MKQRIVHRVASVDLGTVSSRLLLAEVEDGRIVRAQKETRITDLGEGVDANGVLLPRAMARVLSACEEYVGKIRDYAPDAVCCTLTSAARDAQNSGELLAGLRALGLEPEVIEGEVEARLTFYGVAHDFPDELIAVADSGGGSTELAVGTYAGSSSLELGAVRSFDIGCRRMTDRFLGEGARRGEVTRAYDCACAEFASYWKSVSRRPARLVAVGGTVTTLSAMSMGMEEYDSARVHLSTLARADVVRAIERMYGRTPRQIAELPGVQAKRAGVLLGGALVVCALMDSAPFEELTVSENSLMAGMAATLFETVEGDATVVGWKPALTW
ncbi:MAG: hypothetical protein Q4B30_06005 [Coriobacteriaceae bacterium]|nr:hypothetical protein [Coriobacteriaceae bacterium]